jgi:anti-sigma-K factor RskA
MSGMSRDELERHLERLPKEAWERPTPPPPPWPAEEPKPAPRRRLSLRPAAAALASIVLLALGIGAGLLLAGGDDEEAGGGGGLERVELAPVVSAAENAGGTAELRPEAGGRATIELSGLRPSGPRDFYELWLLGDDGQLVSLGSVRVPASGDATLDVELPVDPKEFRYLDLSREPDDGDPGHSTISILRGPVT